jgi:hypothetical protein
MSRCLTRGWLPLDFEFDPQPGVVTSATVRWIEFGSIPLAEPFFWYSVEKARNATPRCSEIDTSIESMLRMSDRLPAAEPAGFIFHISHCGSTLISNAMRSVPNTLVAAEATPLVRLARWYPEPQNHYLRSRWHQTRRRLFESVFRLFAHYSTGETQRLVVKFSSLNLFAMKFVRETWPAIPCVVVVRDPAEVLVSALNESGWLAHKNQPGEPEQFYGWSDPPCPFEEMSNEEYCGQLLGRHLAAALDALDERCQVVDYEDLNPQRICEIANFFGLQVPAKAEDFREIFHVYSKDPAKALSYRDDRERKRRLISAQVRAAARKWAMPSYNELRARSAG